MSAEIEVPRISSRRSRLTNLGAEGAQISRVPYLPGLDGMRAIAVVIVMIYHANSDWLPGGYLGVEIFFVISGYLITLLLVAETEKAGRVDLTQFWMRRARRLLPALFTMMLLLTVWTALFERAALGKLRGDVLAGVFYVSNWYQIWTGAGYTEANDFAPLRHLWSLAVEEQYYVIWPLVMVGLLGVGARRVANRALWLFTAAVVVTILTAVLFYEGPIGTPEITPDAYWEIGGRPISIIDSLYLSTITRAGGLLLGGAFALIWRPRAVMRGPLREKGPQLDLTAFLGLLILAVMSWYVYLIDDQGGNPLLFRGGFFVAGLATLMMIAAVTHSGAITGKLLANPVLLWIGTRSYGLYLYHWPIYQIIRDVAGNKLTVGEFAFAMVLTVIITEASYRFIEVPIRTGALKRMWFGDGGYRSRRPGVLVGVGAVVAGLSIFAVWSLATADLEQNEVQQSLEAAEESTCDVLVDFDCDGVPDAEAVAAAETGAAEADETPSDEAEPAVEGSEDGSNEGGDPAVEGEVVAEEGNQPSNGNSGDDNQPDTTQAGTEVERLAVGDSVMKGAAPALSDYGFTVSAEESRAFVNGLDYVQGLAAQNRLGQTVVIHLGTNGTINQSDMDAMMETLSDVKQVVLLTIDVPREWTAPNNELIFNTAAAYANVDVLDWAGLVDSCPGNCLYDDGIHLRPDGQDYYAQLVAEVTGVG
jgi:peptidoglycan/LPS O-acetylase OafA/YrhL